MKRYIVLFEHLDGSTEEVELTTDKIEWSIDQWKRNRAIASHKILKEENANGNSSTMLFG
tara:strand:- start:1303 stop:1482 length:180 start_codon:yes stop_codon:yes gene_type:complete